MLSSLMLSLCGYLWLLNPFCVQSIVFALRAIPTLIVPDGTSGVTSFVAEYFYPHFHSFLPSGWIHIGQGVPIRFLTSESGVMLIL